MKEKVTKFITRNDNSSCLAGKQGAKKDGRNYKQKRTLNDYLMNLHRNFFEEESQHKDKLICFLNSRMRPKHVNLVKFSNRRTCLCQRHQNMVL